jgi:hypothetical protein
MGLVEHYQVNERFLFGLLMKKVSQLPARIRALRLIPAVRTPATLRPG